MCLGNASALIGPYAHASVVFWLAIAVRESKHVILMLSARAIARVRRFDSSRSPDSMEAASG